MDIKVIVGILLGVLTVSPVLAGSLASKIGDYMPSLDELGVELKGAVGVAVISSPDYSGSADNSLSLLPVLIASYKDKYYFKVKRAGVWLYSTDDRHLKLGLAIEPRGGYGAGDSDILSGMGGRETSLEAGVALYWRTPIGVLLEASYDTDISSTADGNSANLKVSVPFYRNQSLTLAGSAAVEWLSRNVVNYYYGVIPSEATVFRSAYSPGSTFNYTLAFISEYRFDEHWRLISGASLRRLGDESAESPIVTDRYQKLGYVGLGWGF
ncbi:MAG TPA: MipA/OmpV family protein [Acidiferrobacteraceae bacterium]|nr:MipA/OmpV family protein [Acidiferrobacteraceae bacterium]